MSKFFENFSQKLDADYKEIFNYGFFENFVPNFFFKIIFFFVIFLGFFFVHKILNKKFENNNIINKELIKKVFGPIYLLIIFFFSLDILKLFFELIPSLKMSLEAFLINLPKIKKILMIISIGLSFFYLIKYLQKNYILDWRDRFEKAKKEGKEIKEIDVSKIDLISKISTITLFSIVIFGIIGSLGINLTPLAAIGGAGGLIVGFATKDMLSNFFGLFSVYLDKPFQIGDNINITDKDIKGFIEEIGLRTTKIRTYDQTVIYVPNSIFNTSIIENISRLVYRVLRYDLKIKNNPDTVEKIEEVIQFMKNEIYNLEIVPKIDANPRIYISHLNDQFIDLKFVVNLLPSNQVIFEQNSQIVINLVYKNLRDKNLEILSYIPDISIVGGKPKT
jgi:small-conductance mechanosensitive channel